MGCTSLQSRYFEFVSVAFMFGFWLLNSRVYALFNLNIRVNIWVLDVLNCWPSQYHVYNVPVDDDPTCCSCCNCLSSFITAIEDYGARIEDWLYDNVVCDDHS